MIPLSYSAKEILRRRARTLLTLLGIAIGVASIVAIRVASAAAADAYGVLYETVGGRASLEVVAADGGGFDEGLVAEVARGRGVEAAVPVIAVPAALRGAQGNVPVLALGIDPARDGAVRTLDLVEGSPLEAGEPGVLLEREFARSLGLSVGSRARLVALTGVVELPVRGLLRARGAAAFNGGAIAFLDLREAQRRFGLTGRVNAVHVVVASSTRVEDAEADLAGRLPPGLGVQPPAARAEIAQDSLLSTQLGLSAVSALSLVAGAFIILNTFFMNVAERRRSFAILRALGATRGGLLRLVLREAALLGLVGSALGMVAGAGAAMGMVAAMEGLLRIEMPPLRFTAGPFLLAGALGPGLALLAAWGPARRAAKDPPLAGLLEDPRSRREDLRRWPQALGVALVAVTLVLMFGFVTGRLGPAAIAPAMGITLVGFVLALPIVLLPLLRLARPLAERWLASEGRLAARQLLRRPLRTSLTAGVLFVAVVVGIAVGSAILNNVEDVWRWYDRVLYHDFYVRGTMPDTGTTSAAPLPESMKADIEAIDGVDDVQRIRFALARAESRPVVVLAVSWSEGRRPNVDLRRGDPADVERRLRAGETVLGTALARRMGKDVGDVITFDTRGGPRPVRVAGLAAEYTAGGASLYLEWETAKALLGFEGVHAFLVVAEPGRAAAVAGPLRALCEARGCLFQPQGDLRTAIEQMLDGVLAMMWMMLLLVFVVAAIGIVNTLAMSVVEQTREMGMLRAVALTRRRVRRLVLAEAGILGAASLLPGALVGVALAWLFNLATYPLVGHDVPFDPRLGLVGICLAVAMATALVAGVFPARRAARLDIVRALQME